jgi:hypothetical protein
VTSGHGRHSKGFLRSAVRSGGLGFPEDVISGAKAMTSQPGVAKQVRMVLPMVCAHDNQPFQSTNLDMSLVI